MKTLVMNKTEYSQMTSLFTNIQVKKVYQSSIKFDW